MPHRNRRKWTKSKINIFIYSSLPFFFAISPQQSRDNSIKTNDKELLERIHRLECKEDELLKELHEMHEQNELLEFRIIELEEGNDKVSSFQPIKMCFTERKWHAGGCSDISCSRDKLKNTRIFDCSYRPRKRIASL